MIIGKSKDSHACRSWLRPLQFGKSRGHRFRTSSWLRVWIIRESCITSAGCLEVWVSTLNRWKRKRIQRQSAAHPYSSSRRISQFPHTRILMKSVNGSQNFSENRISISSYTADQAGDRLALECLCVRAIEKCDALHLESASCLDFVSKNHRPLARLLFKGRPHR